jgi:tRNA-dihydrouridine synthase B
MRLPWLAGPSVPLYLAPMAGFTDRAFRELCKEQGADVMVTEFVMANKFLDPRGEKEAWEKVDFTPQQRPMGVQIFGSEPEKMAEAAHRIVDRLQPDFIDINYGCPAPKVVDNAAGSSLLRDPCRLQAVAAAVVTRVGDRVPVTAKIRTGWDDSSVNAVSNARLLEAVGIEAIAVHGRTKMQGYSGDADWDTIHAVADAVGIPVIGNGSIDGPERVRPLIATGKVAGLMIGRSALGNPWIFRQIKDTLAHGTPAPEPSIEERWLTLLRYCKALTDHREKAAWDYINWMRPRLKAFAKGFRVSKELRRILEKVGTIDELEALTPAVMDLHHAALELNGSAQ